MTGVFGGVIVLVVVILISPETVAALVNRGNMSTRMRMMDRIREKIKNKTPTIRGSFEKYKKSLTISSGEDCMCSYQVM